MGLGLELKSASESRAGCDPSCSLPSTLNRPFFSFLAPSCSCSSEYNISTRRCHVIVMLLLLISHYRCYVALLGYSDLITESAM